jgi:hypothetical protein
LGYPVGLPKQIFDERGFSYVVSCADGMVNTFTILQQFEWAYENKVFEEDTWYYSSRKESAKKDEKTRLNTKAIFDNTDIFIITLGLSEVWYNKKDGNIFWKAIPRRMFDPKKHAFRVSSCAENIENIEKMISIIRRNRPNSKIILTLSPVGLLATFRPISCITANSVSKSILRTAIDEVMLKEKSLTK